MGLGTGEAVSTDVSTDTEAAGTAARLPVGVLAAVTAIAALSLDTYVPGLPALARDLDTSASGAQLTLTACLLGLAAGQLVWGPLSDVRGRRRPLLVALGVYAAASLACALAPDIGSLTVLRFVQGAAAGAGRALPPAVIRDHGGGARAARAFSAVMAINGIAPIAAPVAGGQLLRFVSWRGVFVALAVLGALLLVVAARRLPESLPPHRRRPGGRPPYGRLLRDRTFMGYVLALGLCMGSMFAYIAGSSFVLQDLHGLSPQSYSAVFAVNAAGIVLAIRTGARLVGRTGPGPLLRTGLLLTAAGALGTLAAVLTGAGLPPLLAALFPAVAGVGLVMPNAMALALEPHAGTAGTASALLGCTPFVVGAVVSPLVGAAGRGSAVPMGVTMAVLATGAVAAGLFLVRGPVPADTDTAR